MINSNTNQSKARVARAVTSAVLLVALVTPSAFADDLSATLDGKRIRVDQVAMLNCHDFDFPVIRCFSTADLVASDIEGRFARDGSAGARLLLGGFVTAYADAFYEGSSISLSSDKSSLSSLGWNDRISSFKSSGATGGFWEHSPPGGFYYTYTSTTQVPTLSGTYNDKFSAFNID